MKNIIDNLGVRTSILLLGIVIYLGIIIGFQYVWSIDSLLFSTADAIGYRSAMKWLIGAPDEHSAFFITIRPFLYPAVLAFFNSINFVYGICLLQFFFWLLSLNLIIKSLQLLKIKDKWVFIAVIPFITNVTGILITLHALTESLTILLLSLFVFLVIVKFTHEKMDQWPLIILTAVLLTVVKPLYLYLFYFSLLFGVLDFLMKKSYPSLKSWGILLIAGTVLFAQYRIMYAQTGEYKVSDIGEITIKNYFLKSVYSKAHPELSEEELKNHIFNMSKPEGNQFITEHPKLTLSAYFHNVFYKNMGAHSTLSRIPVKRGFLIFWSGTTNRIFFLMHVLFLILVVRTLYLSYKHKSWNQLLIYLTLSCPVYLIFFTSGITFLQGDRIIVTAIPAWIILYVFVFRKKLQITE